MAKLSACAVDVRPRVLINTRDRVDIVRGGACVQLAEVLHGDEDERGCFYPPSPHAHVHARNARHCMHTQLAQ